MGKIKGWKNTSRTHSDGSRTIEWRSKFKILNINHYQGWNVAVTSLRRNEPPQLMADTNHTKQEAYRIAIDYMRSHPNG